MIKKKISIIIPLFNSAETIEKLISNILKEDSLKKFILEIVLVNDGSTDGTHRVMESIIKDYPDKIKYIKLAKNFGEHNAVMCGLNYVTGEHIIIMDDDFQNPPSEVSKLIKKLEDGYSVVYSYYKKKKHSFFRNIGSRFNNWIATKLLKKPRDLYLSSFKGLTLSLAKKIVLYKGPFPYIDGIILQSTKNIGTQLCAHEKSEKGKSSYSFKKLIHLWLSVFTGFSITPLRFASFIGFAMSGFAVLMIVFFIISYLSGGIFFKQSIPPGWASMIVVITFFGGLQLILLGIIGEYLGRLFLTANKMPQFIVEDIFAGDKKNKK